MNRTADAKSARSRSEYWRELVRQQEGSGQSVHAFCAARGFTEQSFYHWKKRLNKDAPVSFALVTSDGSNSIEGSLLELDFGSGQRLRIPRGADAATLRNAHCQVKKKTKYL